MNDGHVLHRDEHLVIVNKPAGSPVHPTRDPDRPNVERAVADLLGLEPRSNRPGGAKDASVAVVHRLDAWTSGALVLALTSDAARTLNQLFADRGVAKRYEAVCIGGPEDNDGEMKHYLKRRRDTGRKAMHPVRSGGKVAISRYQVTGRGSGLSLVNFELLTGRTHQLRVQTAAEGWPILGDEVYGVGWDTPMANAVPPDAGRRAGQLLHARSIEFVHPYTGELITIDAPPPPDFEPVAGPLRL